MTNYWPYCIHRDKSDPVQITLLNWTPRFIIFPEITWKGWKWCPIILGMWISTQIQWPFISRWPTLCLHKFCRHNINCIASHYIMVWFYTSHKCWMVLRILANDKGWDRQREMRRIVGHIIKGRIQQYNGNVCRWKREFIFKGMKRGFNVNW